MQFYMAPMEGLTGYIFRNVDTLKAFHDEILNGYCEIMSGDRNTLFKMKEIWSYLGDFLRVGKNCLKR